MSRIETFKQHLAERRAVKVIAGIDNFNIENIKKVVCSADQANASAVDVAYSEDIIRITKGITNLPIFVSSIEPIELANAVELGVDAIEVGNYDVLYKKGIRLGSEEILNIVKETLRLLNGKKTFISVTVPGHIDINEQITLAKQLEELNIDLIQTEGSATVSTSNGGARGLLETAQVSIANTIDLTRNIDIPVMTASGITTTTAPLAFAAGASAIGVGSSVNKLDSTIAMIAVIRTLVEDAARSTQRALVNA